MLPVLPLWDADLLLLRYGGQGQTTIVAELHSVCVVSVRAAHSHEGMGRSSSRSHRREQCCGGRTTSKQERRTPSPRLTCSGAVLGEELVKEKIPRTFLDSLIARQTDGRTEHRTGAGIGRSRRGTTMHLSQLSRERARSHMPACLRTACAPTGTIVVPRKSLPLPGRTIPRSRHAEIDTALHRHWIAHFITSSPSQ